MLMQIHKDSDVILIVKCIGKAYIELIKGLYRET